MALITCPECGQQVSDRAKACIHCGNPMSAGMASITLIRRRALNGMMTGWAVYVDNIPQADLLNGEHREIIREQSFTVQVESPAKKGALAITVPQGSHDQVEVSSGLLGLRVVTL